MKFVNLPLISILLKLNNTVPGCRFDFLTGSQLHQLFKEGGHFNVVVNLKFLCPQHHFSIGAVFVNLQIQ